MEYKAESLGEVVDANRLVSSSYEIFFRVDLEYAKLCSTTLDSSAISRFFSVALSLAASDTTCDPPAVQAPADRGAWHTGERQYVRKPN